MFHVEHLDRRLESLRFLAPARQQQYDDDVHWCCSRHYKQQYDDCQVFFAGVGKIFSNSIGLLVRPRRLYSSSPTMSREICTKREKILNGQSPTQACPCPTLVLYGQRGARVKRSFADFAAVLPSFLRPGALLARKVKKKFCENLGKFLLTFGPNEPARDKNYDFFRVSRVKVVDKLSFSIYNVYIK